MHGLQAFFVAIGAFFASFFPIHKTAPDVKTNTDQKVIFQIAPSATPNPNAPTISPTQTPSTTPSQTTITQFVYPNGNQTNNSGNSITMQTADSAQTVSSWYQQKISSLGFRATSIVQTNVNGNASDILDVSNDTTEIRIQITRGSSDALTTILITSSPSHQ